MIRPEALLHPMPAGLFCEPGGFYIDPVRAVDRAIITHGHADHARAGHSHVLATPETLAIMAVRYGEGFAAHTQALAYGERISLNGVDVSLAPAGHILGSAQVVLHHHGLSIVVSGDFKRRADSTTTAFEPMPAHVFISEATFALPVFRHPCDRTEITKLLQSLKRLPDRAHFVGAYSLGKAQRVIRLLRELDYDEPIFMHGAMVRLCALYEQFGVPLGQLEPATVEVRGDKARFNGKIVIGPPSALGQEAWARRLGEPIVAFASGWMGVRQRAKQAGVELPLVISDHADWDELIQTAEEVTREELWITHGRDDALARWGELRGLKTRPLRLVGYEEEGGS
jgi:putative mRNA 3-end processing factor